MPVLQNNPKFEPSRASTPTHVYDLRNRDFRKKPPLGVFENNQSKIRHSEKSQSTETTVRRVYDLTESRTRDEYRARYYSTELGQFISRDPLEYVDGMSMYSGYFAQRMMMDPSGEKRIEIFANAFIQWSKFRFFYRQGVQPILGVWHGDGRGFTKSMRDVRKNYRRSRGFNYILIDYEKGKQGRVIYNLSGSNYTAVSYSLWGVHYTDKATAAPPKKADITANKDGSFDIKIDVATAMPLDPLAPAIDWEYNIKIDCKGKVTVKGTVDLFPWHEIIMFDQSDKSEILKGNYSPSGPTVTPFDLGAPGKSISESGMIK